MTFLDFIRALAEFIGFTVLFCLLFFCLSAALAYPLHSRDHPTPGKSEVKHDWLSRPHTARSQKLAINSGPAPGVEPGS